MQSYNLPRRVKRAKYVTMHRVQVSNYSFTVNTLYLRTQKSIWRYNYTNRNPHAFLSYVRDFGSRAD